MKEKFVKCVKFAQSQRTINYLDRAWSDDDSETPVVTVVDRNNNVVLSEEVHLVGPAAHHLVSLFGAFRRGQTGVKHAVKHMNGGHLSLGELGGGQVLDLQVDEVVVQVLFRS